MSNECWRVIMLHALTEIRRILQIEEYIPISCQSLTYAVTKKGHGCCTFSSRITIPRKVQVKLSTYKPSVLDEKQLHLK